MHLIKYIYIFACRGYKCRSLLGCWSPSVKQKESSVLALADTGGTCNRNTALKEIPASFPKSLDRFLCLWLLKQLEKCLPIASETCMKMSFCKQSEMLKWWLKRVRNSPVRHILGFCLMALIHMLFFSSLKKVVSFLFSCKC